MQITWKNARDFADLRLLMALWLEGRIPSRPGYEQNCGPDEETRGLISTLAAACRGGFLTDVSQPGSDARIDGHRWMQRPAVQGFVADPELVAALQRTGRAAGLAVVIDGQRDDHRTGSIPVTTLDNQVVTGFGSLVPRRHLRATWTGVSRAAVDQLVTAHQVALVDLEFGPASTRLWEVLTVVTTRRGAGR
jgi:hypothetical protein